MIGGSLECTALRRGEEWAVTVAELGGEGGYAILGWLECFESISEPIDKMTPRKKRGPAERDM